MPPDRFAKRLLDFRHAAPPARLLLLPPRNDAAVELELRVRERRRQSIGVLADQSEGQVLLPRRQRHLGEDGVDGFQVVRLPDDHLGDLVFSAVPATVASARRRK